MSQQVKKEEVINLRKQGLSFGEIARELGISRSSASSIYQRAKESEKCKCKWCGITIKQTVGHRPRLYCSNNCRMNWWKANANHKINNTAICLNCGKKFIYHESRLRKYCSITCAYNHRKTEVSDNEK